MRELVRTFPVVALVGPRQVGKTTLLEKIFPDYNYTSLDLASNAEAAETQPEYFLQKYPPPVILDEIQYAPTFFRYIKTYVDANKATKGHFILTGSQNFMLMENLSESLAGRVAIIPFLGLSGREWQKAEAISNKHNWMEFLWKGYFPGLWSAEELLPSS